MKPETIKIDDIEYVRKDTLATPDLNGLSYHIVRTRSSGVFAGYIESRNKDEVSILQARRLWYWAGAASLSQLAIHGTSNPGNCKFPEAVSRIVVMDPIEILDVTLKAQESIAAVEVWKR